MANDISKIVKNVFIKYEHYIGVQIYTLVYVEVKTDLIISVVWCLTHIQKECDSNLKQERSILAENFYVFPFDFITGRKFLEQLSDCTPLQNCSVV
jgi:hypothetical protein